MAENMENKAMYDGEEQEIDLIALVKRLWSKKMFIIYVTVAFMVLGVFVAIFSPKQYTAGCLFVPQTSQKGVSGSMASLASLAGINLGGMSSAESLSPMIYPQVLGNIEFKKDLMYSKFKFEEFEEPITLLDYYTNEEYNKPSVLGIIKKYTIGLPGVILGAIRGEQEEQPIIAGAENTLNTFTKDEYICSKILGEIISLNVNDKEGYIELSAVMGEPVVAAEVAQRAFELLGNYVTEFKIEKAKLTLQFVNERLSETQEEFEEKQLAYAKFKDANRVISSATARIEEEKLKSEFDLVNTMYNELTRQKVQVELQVKEDTPVLAVVKPVVVPIEKSKPQRSMILIAFTFLGGCAGCGGVLGLDFLKKQGSAWPRRWELEEEAEA